MEICIESSEPWDSVIKILEEKSMNPKLVSEVRIPL